MLPAQRASREIWIYALMVALALCVAGLGLYQNRLLLGRYQAAVQQGLSWTERLNRYGKLAQLSGEVASFSLQMYESGDFQAEIPELLTRMERLDAALLSDQDELSRHDTRESHRLTPLFTYFDRMVAAQEQQRRQVSLLLTAVRTGRIDLANRALSAMNRDLIALQRALEELRARAGTLQRNSQEEALARAAMAPRDELLIASLIVILLGALTLYGLRLSRQARKAELEREALLAAVQRRSDDMRLVLDNVSQGLLTLSRDGVPLPERSAMVERLLGPLPEGEPLWHHLGGIDARFASSFALAWQALVDDVLPLSLCLDQMPQRLRAFGRLLHIGYQPLSEPPVTKVLLVISDHTSEEERERAEAEGRELLVVFDKIGRDRGAVTEFFTEAGRLVDAVVAGAGGAAEQRRDLHTLKGNSGLFGLTRLAALCHQVEDRLQDGDLLPEDVALLQAAWQRERERLSGLLALGGARQVTVEDGDYEALIEKVEQGAPRRELLAELRAWRLQQVQQRLSHFADQVVALAQRLGKGQVRAMADGGRLRLSRERFAPFWAAFTHVVRNAVDHGLEPPALRRQLGKAEPALVTLSAQIDGEALCVSIADDGQGIDWGRLAQRLTERGLPASSHDDLVAALFLDGVSTKEEVTEVSGRGVGMGALQRAVADLGGTITVDSERGKGTRFCFRFPMGANCAEGAASCAGSLLG